MLLMGFGKDCKIISPKHLKNQILSDLKELLDNYNNE
jgi:predicted DNA-binding transcriptional regulator YafY